MISKICFATNNQNKLSEVKQKLGGDFNLVGLAEIGCDQELPENQKTLEGNSLEKADFIYKNYQVDCFADDTGLEVYSLDGAPGVISARYAGMSRSAQDNIDLLLSNLREKKDKRAQFRTVITLIISGKSKQFEGIVKGHIIEEMRGDSGFGYDPIFIPKGFDKTFAQMTMEEKNAISHRAIATEKLIAFLQKLK